MGYSFKYELYERVCVLSYCLSGVSILLSVIILSVAFYLYRKPHTKSSVDRVSFRLLCYALAVQIVYDVMYIAIYTSNPKALPSKTCGVMVYVMLAAMGVTNWLCTCIGVNLMALIVFNLSPARDKLERGYITTSFILGMGPPLIPAILGHFGPDTTVYGDCYMTAVEPSERLLYLILDIYLWQGLSCVIASIATISVLVVLFRSSRKTSKALFAGNPLNANLIPVGTLGTLNDKFVKIAIRISLYPIALVVINTFLTAADIVYTFRGLNTEADWVLGVFYIVLYGGRGIVFGVLAIFVDPCLRKGLKALRPPVHHPPPWGLSTVPELTYDLAQHDQVQSSRMAVASLPYTPPLTEDMQGDKSLDTIESGDAVDRHVPLRREAEKMFEEVEARL